MAVSKVKCDCSCQASTFNKWDDAFMEFSKCICTFCEQHIEYPNEMYGQEINCPSCQQALQLPKPAKTNSTEHAPLNGGMDQVAKGKLRFFFSRHQGKPFPAVCMVCCDFQAAKIAVREIDVGLFDQEMRKTQTLSGLQIPNVKLDRAALGMDLGKMHVAYGAYMFGFAGAVMSYFVSKATNKSVSKAEIAEIENALGILAALREDPRDGAAFMLEHLAGQLAVIEEASIRDAEWQTGYFSGLRLALGHGKPKNAVASLAGSWAQRRSYSELPVEFCFDSLGNKVKYSFSEKEIVEQIGRIMSEENRVGKQEGIEAAMQKPRPQQCGLATASLILAALGIFVLVTGIPAFICGHLAMRKIRKSQGSLTGSTAAAWGILLGYAELVMAVGIYIVVASIL